MFEHLRKALASPHGLAMLLPLFAISWGLGRIAALAEQLQLDVEALAEQRAGLEEALQATLAEQSAAPAAEYPTREDVDPLDRAAQLVSDARSAVADATAEHFTPAGEQS